MKKSKYALYTILLFFLFTGCSDEIDTLKYRVGVLEQELSEVKSELTELKSELKSSAEFEKEMECQALFDRLKKRWNNIVGCYYSPYYNTCMVKYRKNGEIKEAKIEDMSDSD